MAQRHHKDIAESRKAIHDANVVAFLLDIVQGKPAPVRDQAGRIVEWTDPPDLPLRVSTATALAKKVLPDLAASQLEIGSADGQAIQLVFAPGILAPGSDAQVIEHEEDDQDDATPAQLEEDATPTVDEALTPGNTRGAAPRPGLPPQDAQATVEGSLAPDADPVAAPGASERRMTTEDAMAEIDRRSRRQELRRART
jgi:hypothetical protein